MDRSLVLPEDFGDYAWEVASKGYFELARVRPGDRVLNVTFYEARRLAQDVSDELKAARVFTSARLLVIREVTPENIRAAIELAPADLFD